MSPRGARRPKPTDPLDARQRAAVTSAGAIGLSLVAAGAGLVWGLLVAALVLAVIRSVIIDLFDDVEWGRSVIAWIEQLDPGWLVPLVLGLVLLAVAAIALGCWLSVRRMRTAGVVGATAVTVRGAAIGTGLQAVLSTLSSWLLGLLVLLTGVVGFWIIASIWVVASIALSALIGWLAGPRTWLAIARREARRVGPPLAADG
ncbi:hypothetical protein SAMN04487783_1222 [Agrococcus baldri]|uniref:Uncharacterized protein n=1 Tax=Agrococcus baldri TaxID=153730 RepID=A0AA94HLW5_9MICO|nr:hypothetical protein [Agrococcus baldri]SFS09185.1 hypothetical protein SAMN04487783_1222 [Agrococcus baldri]